MTILGPEGTLKVSTPCQKKENVKRGRNKGKDG
jgi:hypothetical protein